MLIHALEVTFLYKFLYKMIDKALFTILQCMVH